MSEALFVAGVFSVLAQTVRALLHGKGVTDGLAELASKGRQVTIDLVQQPARRSHEGADQDRL
jgi:hypothetical protein